MSELRVAMIGFGGIGAVHKAAYDRLLNDGAPIRLVAVFDKNAECIKSAGKTNLGEVNVGSFEDIKLYTDLEELLQNEEFDIADICLPTFLHKEFTVKLLRAGKHVLCEKPMALTYSDCLEMVNTARECERELLVGQCLRFDPPYLFIKDLVESGELGAARRISMGRLSYMPAWSGWFGDVKKSGGCITDLHIHDLDMIRFLFGEPKAVSACSYPEDVKYQFVTTRLDYDGLIAEAEASFDEAKTMPFSMWYRVRFDKASVYYKHGEVKVYPDEGEPYVVDLPEKDRIAEEIRYLAEVVLGKTKNLKNSPEDAARSIGLCEAVRESALRGEKIPFCI